MTTFILIAVASLIIGAAFTWLFMRSQSAGAEARATALQQELLTARNETVGVRDESRILNEHKTRALETVAGLEATLQKERESSAEKFELLTKASEDLRNAFGSLANDALQKNNEAFLRLAATRFDTLKAQAVGDIDARKTAIEEILVPVKSSLLKVDEQLRLIESARIDAYATLRTQLETVSGTQQNLESETRKLVQALRGGPNVRGMWGQLHLKRVVELAGMQEHCDFSEQVSVETDESKQQRPDMIINLPGGKTVVVDAKAPLKAYLESLDAPDEEQRRVKLVQHANQVRDQVANLASKRYWQQFPSAPDFVVLFLPGEVFFSAALEHAPTLLEEGSGKVLLASPTILISLLRSVSYGWQQQKLAENSLKISELGRKLYESLTTMADHVQSLGTHIRRTVNAYNETVGSLERNVLIGARRFRDLGVSSTTDIPEPKQVQDTPRVLQSADWVTGKLLTGGDETDLVPEKSEKAKA
jgi:DNA recombination protein RmuC